MLRWVVGPSEAKPAQVFQTNWERECFRGRRPAQTKVRATVAGVDACAMLALPASRQVENEFVFEHV